MDLSEIAKWASAGTAWGLSIWMAKHFFKSMVTDAVEGAKHAATRAETAAYKLSEEVVSLRVQIAKENSALHSKVSDETGKMSGLFAECARQAQEANGRCDRMENHVSRIESEMKLAGGRIVQRVRDVEAEAVRVKSEVTEIREHVFRVSPRKKP